MNQINEFFLRDVRCFEGEHRFKLRPLTILVGENSTGKSTVLGCIQALVEFLSAQKRSEIDFNSEPYLMGAFTDIVRRSNSKKASFQLGIEQKYRGKTQKFVMTLAERGTGSEPIIQNVRYILEQGEIVLSAIDDEKDWSREPVVKVSKREKENYFEVTVNREWFGWVGLDDLHFFVSRLSDESDDASTSLLDFIGQQVNGNISKDRRTFRHRRLSRELRLVTPEVHSLAPIRSKPKRTYDPLKETETPDGSEIPMVLMNLSTSSETEWKELREQLLNFGKLSGMFTDIQVKKLGRSKSDPFQLRIKVRGPRTNLMDVGYGVSQILPILVRILTEKSAMFLMQQPEVHLHPKGQAELASLLVEMLKTRSNSFVIETHSDYIIDRIRIDILKGNLKPSDVSLVFLEPVGNKVVTHNIEFDGQANMKNVPETFRSFFLKETDELLGFIRE